MGRATPLLTRYFKPIFIYYYKTAKKQNKNTF